MDDWEQAGTIAAEALAYGKKLLKVETPLLEIAEKVETKILQLGGRPAFPVNLSLNSIAAHYTPSLGDETRIREGDLVKLDVGVHVNGAIGDNAVTVSFGAHDELIRAAEEALRAALKTAAIDVPVKDLGKAVQEVITSAGFTPIVNLSGHGLKEYQLHSGMTIPNFDNGDMKRLQAGQIIAIEPFATTGEGKVMESKPSGIYRLEQKKPTRNPIARKVLAHIEKEYMTLPFAKRWILKDFRGGHLALSLLEQQGIIAQYAQLTERAKGIVSQAEHTVLIGEKTRILTRRPD